MAQSVKSIKTVVLVLDQSNTLSFAALVDPLRAANRQAGRSVYDWRFVTPSDLDVQFTSGLLVPASPIARVATCDLLLIVASFEVQAQTTPALVASLQRLGRTAHSVAGVDGGPWVMAQSGLLDGHTATTHWEDIETFAQQFPEVDTVNARYVTSGNRMTSAGAAPTLEMMLARIELDHSVELARKVAGAFVLDHRPPSGRPQMRRPLSLRNAPLVARAHEHMETTLETPIEIKNLAKKLHVSPRALQLQFKAALGTTPQQHYLSLRLSEAHRLITETDMPIQDVALATGFSSQSSFSRAFNRAFGRSARRIRKFLS